MVAKDVDGDEWRPRQVQNLKKEIPGICLKAP